MLVYKANCVTTASPGKNDLLGLDFGNLQSAYLITHFYPYRFFFLCIFFAEIADQRLLLIAVDNDAEQGKFAVQRYSRDHP